MPLARWEVITSNSALSQLSRSVPELVLAISAARLAHRTRCSLMRHARKHNSER